MRIFKQAALLAALLALFGTAALAQNAGGIKGKVRNQKGDGLAGAVVTARLDGKDVKTVKTDAKGSFELRGLEPGTYNFVFERNGYASGVKYNVEIKQSVVNLGDNLVLMVDQGTLVLLSGSVFNQDGRSITGAKIEIERIASDGSTKKIATAYTNYSGEFTLRQPEGNATYRVTATFKGVKASKEIVVDSVGRYTTAITLNIPREETEK